MKSGYIQLTIDQQPFLQGYVPIHELHLINKYKLGAYDVNTGKALVTPAQVRRSSSCRKRACAERGIPATFHPLPFGRRILPFPRQPRPSSAPHDVSPRSCCHGRRSAPSSCS